MRHHAKNRAKARSHRGSWLPGTRTWRCQKARNHIREMRPLSWEMARGGERGLTNHANVGCRTWTGSMVPMLLFKKWWGWGGERDAITRQGSSGGCLYWVCGQRTICGNGFFPSTMGPKLSCHTWWQGLYCWIISLAKDMKLSMEETTKQWEITKKSKNKRRHVHGSEDSAPCKHLPSSLRSN